MEEYSFINYLQICYLILHNDVPTRLFVGFFHMSEYEYNKCIDTITDMSPYFGVCFTWGKDCISYIVIDQKMFDEKSLPCTSFFTINSTAEWDSRKISEYYLGLRFLLAEEEYVKLDDLTEELFCSKSALRDDMKHIRDLYDDFGITLTTIPHHGLKAEGDEAGIRACIDYLQNINEAQIIITRNKRLKYLDFYGDEYKRIKLRIGELSTRRMISFSENSLVMVSRYTVISRWRIQKGFLIESERINRAFVSSSDEFELASDIVTELFGIDYPNDQFWNEVSLMAALIACTREYVESQVYHSVSNNPNISKNVENLYANITELIYKQWNIKLPDNCQNYMRSALKRVVLKDYFDFLRFRGLRQSSNSYSHFEYPLIRVLMKDVIQEIRKTLGIVREYKNLHVTQFYEVASCLLICINSTEVPIDGLNIAVSSEIGVIGEQQSLIEIKNRIRTRLISRCTIVESSLLNSYQVRNENLFLVDQKIYTNENGHFIHRGNHFDDLPHLVYNQISILKSYGVNVLVDNIEWAKDLSVNDMFFSESFERCMHTVIRNYILIICMRSIEDNQIYISIGTINERKIVENRSLRKYMKVICDPHKVNWHLLNLICHYLLTDEMIYENLLKTNSVNELDIKLKDHLLY